MAPRKPTPRAPQLEDDDLAYYDAFFEDALDPHPLELMAGDPDNLAMLHCTNYGEDFPAEPR